MLKSNVSTVLILIALFSSSAYGQATTQQPNLTEMPPTTPQGAEGGLWRVDKNVDPILRLKNILLKEPLTITPVIYFADGTEFDLSPVILEPAGVAQVDIRKALQGVPASLRSHVSAYGMIGISYSWSWPSVIATIQNTDEVASLTTESSVHADTLNVHQSTDATTPRTIQGMWWSPTSGSDGFVAVSNAALVNRPVVIELTDDNGNRLAARDLLLGMHQTVLVKLSDLLGRVISKKASGGIKIQYAGAADSVLVSAGIEDEAVGYSSTPLFVEQRTNQTKPAGSIVLNSPGLMLGKPDPDMLFPANTRFAPFSVLHNASIQPLSVAVSFTFDQSGGTPVKRVLDTIVLQPDQTVQLDYSRYFNRANPLPDGYGELSASYYGNEGDLLFQSGSVDQSQNYVFGVTTSVQAASASKTICFWTIEGDTDSMISIWNWSAAPEDIDLTLYFHGGHYRLPVHLEGLAAFNLDLMKLARSQKPDPEGNVLSQTFTSGSAMLSSSDGEIATIRVAASTAVFNVRNATCGVTCETCNGLIAVSVSPAPMSLAKSSTQQANAQGNMNTGSIVGVSGGSWSVTSGITSINSSGMVAGISPGSNNTEFQVSNFYTGAGYICEGTTFSCPTGNFSAGGPTTVSAVIPHHIEVLSGTTASVSCPSGLQPARTITYAINDINNNPILAPTSLRENVPPTFSSCNNGSISTGSTCTLNTQYLPGGINKFNDFLFPGCRQSSAPNPCGFTFSNQQWQWCSPNGNISIGTVGYDNVNSSTISVNGNIYGMAPATIILP